MKQTLKYSDITINGVELTAKTVESQRKKYLMHFQGRVKPVIDSEHTFPFFIVEHDPTYNKVDRFVYFDSDGNWHCDCTGYHTRKWCSHIFAVLFERGF